MQNKLFILFLIMSMFFISRSYGEVNIGAKSHNNFDNRIEIKKLKSKMKIERHKILNWQDSGITINGRRIKKVALKNRNNKKWDKENYQLDLTKEEEEVIKLYNREKDTGLIPISVEETTIQEVEQSGNILMKIIDGIFSTKNIDAKTTVTKINYWGVGYEVFKVGSTLLYCVEYGPFAGTSYDKYNDFEKFLKNHLKWSTTKIANAQKIGLWATYFTKNTNPYNYKYYASGQSLIWNQWHPAASNAYKDIINKRVNQHNKQISFNSTTNVRSIKAGTSFSITDNNGELNQWFTIENATEFKNTTGITATKSGNTLKFTNPENNTKTAVGNLKLKKYKDTFDSGVGYGLYASGMQSLAHMTHSDTIESVIMVKNEALEYGRIKVVKDMDDEDLYGQVIRDENNEVLYATEDGKKVMTDSSIIIDTLKYPSKEDMIVNNLFGKTIEFDYPLLEVKREWRPKIDEGGNKIPVVDINGLEPNNPNWLETYKQERVVVKDGDNFVYTAKLDANGNKIYKKAKLNNLTYPSKREMDNIYRGSGIVFTITDKKTNKDVDTMITDSNGEAISNDLLVGEYSIKETKTLDDFVLLTRTYDVEVTKDTTTLVNNGVALINMKRMANMSLLKIDEDTKKPLSNVLFGIYESKDGICNLSDLNGKSLIWSGVTDNKGKLDWITSNERTVCVKELEGKAGYLANNKIHTVKMEFDKIKTIEQTNKSLEMNIVINKENEDNKKLMGVEFELNVYSKNEENNSESYDLVYKEGGLVTDENGQINLKYDATKKFFNEDGYSHKFELIETKGLVGYQTKEPIIFYVALDEKEKLIASEDEFRFAKNIKNLTSKETLNITVINEKETANVLLIKVASDTKEKQVAIYNFKFYDKEGKVYRSEEVSSTLDMPRQLTFSLIDTSKICTLEVKAPKNFVLNQKEKCKETTSLHANQVLEFHFENDRKILAKTGQINKRISLDKVVKIIRKIVSNRQYVEQKIF